MKTRTVFLVMNLVIVVLIISSCSTTSSITQDGSGDTKNLDYHFSNGIESFIEGEYEQADESFSNVIEVNDIHVEALAYRGCVRIKLNEYDLGLIDITKAIEVNPNSTIALWMRSWAYNLKGDYDAALFDIETILNNVPNDPASLNLRGWIYIKMGKHREAIQDLNTATSIAQNPYFYDTRGWAFFYLERIKEARQDAITALEIHPDTYNSRALLYRIDFELGNKAEAQRALESYLLSYEGKDIKDSYFLLLRYLANEIQIEELKNNSEWDDLKVALIGYYPLHNI